MTTPQWVIVLLPAENVRAFGVRQVFCRQRRNYYLCPGLNTNRLVAARRAALALRSTAQLPDRKLV